MLKTQTYTDSQIRDWDAESVAFGYKRGPIDRPSFLPEFWNMEQAEEWVASEDTDPHGEMSDLEREAHEEMQAEGEMIAREEAEISGWNIDAYLGTSFIDGHGNGSGRW